MRTRFVLPSVLLLVTACSSGGSTGPASLDSTPSPTASRVTAPASGQPGRTLSTAGAAPTVTGGTGSGSATGGSTAAAPLTTTAPGRPAASKATRPGSYTYDAKGTVTLGSPGTPQDAGGTSTLTLGPLRGGVQHSTQHSDSTGDTEQDLLVRDAGTYVASLKLTSSAFTKEFRPSPAALLVPDPGSKGASWSWHGTSTDGKTTVSAASSISRSETVTVGGTKVPCLVVQTHLVLRGDVDYTADVTTWWATALRLPVKEHSVGKGSYNGFPFTTDITSTMRSVTPS